MTTVDDPFIFSFSIFHTIQLRLHLTTILCADIFPNNAYLRWFNDSLKYTQDFLKLDNNDLETKTKLYFLFKTRIAVRYL